MKYSDFTLRLFTNTKSVIITFFKKKILLEDIFGESKKYLDLNNLFRPPRYSIVKFIYLKMFVQNIY